MLLKKGDDDAEEGAYQNNDNDEEELFLQPVPSDGDLGKDADVVITSGKITLNGGVSLIVGLMIGSGIFASPGSVVEGVHSTGLTLVIWLLGGLLAMTGALCYIELGCALPRSGAEYLYLRTAYGELVAFLFTWTCALVAKPASCSIISIVFAEYLSRAVYPNPDTPPPAWVIKGLAIACMMVICIVNSIDTSLGMKLQTWTTAAKLVAIAAITLAGIVMLVQQKTDNFSHPWQGSNFSPGALSTATIASLWAYDGWNNLNYAAGEMSNPMRDLPRAILISIPLVMMCYCLVNVAYFAALPISDIAGSDTVGLTYGRVIFGTPGVIIVSLCVATSALGAANGSLIGGSRLTQVAAKDGILPSLFGRIHVTRKTPYMAIAFQGVISIILIIPGNFSRLVAFFSFGMWIFYMLTVLGLLVLRVRQPSLVRPVKAPWPLAVVFSSLAAFLLVNLMREQPIECIACGGFLLVGTAVWGIKRRWTNKSVLRLFATQDFNISPWEETCYIEND